jgi:hypothetical protein
MSDSQWRGLLTALGAFAVLAWGCKKEKKDADANLGHAAVTTVEIWLTQGGDTIRGRYKDPDGPGGRPPTIDTLKPLGGQTYVYFIRLLDEGGNPVQDLTSTIFEGQKNTHQLFILPEPDTLFAKVTPTDVDDLGRPVGGRGLYEQRQGGGSQGALRLVLRHYLNPADKNFGLERGSTDLDVRLPVVGI